MRVAIYLALFAGGLALIIRRLVRSSLYGLMANGGRSPTGYHRGKDSTTGAYDRSWKETARERDP